MAESSFKFLPQGAILQEFIVAGKNIVLGFPSSEPYLDCPCYFGETIGRVANRIQHGKVKQLNGRAYELPVNNGPNHLHGGITGWGKKTFTGPTPVNRNNKEAVQFTYRSQDGEEGYPGTVELRVWYIAYMKEEDGINKTVLETEYEVEFVGQECDETIVNVTNHSYFNLGNGPTIEGTECVLSTSDHLTVDEDAIPLGTIESFPDIEKGKAFTIGNRQMDIDHCFVMDSDPTSIPLDTRIRQPEKLISLSHPDTKIHLDIYSTEPAFQFYTGKFVDIPASEYGPALPPNAGLCVEPSRFINAVNVPEWRKMVTLKKGQIWGSRNIYQAWKA